MSCLRGHYCLHAVSSRLAAWTNQPLVLLPLPHPAGTHGYSRGCRTGTGREERLLLKKVEGVEMSWKDV